MAEIRERGEPRKISPALGGFPFKVFIEINNRYRKKKKKMLNRLEVLQLFLDL